MAIAEQWLRGIAEPFLSVVRFFPWFVVAKGGDRLLASWQIFLRMNMARLWLVLLLLVGFVSRVEAHQVATVELEFLKLETEWRLEGEMDVAYMLPETRNVPGGLPLSREAVMKFDAVEMARVRKETENTLRKLIKITFAGKAVPWRVEFPDFDKDPFELPPEAGDIALITTQIIIDRVEGGGELSIHWFGEKETELIILTEEAETANVTSTLPGGSVVLWKQTGTGTKAPVEQRTGGGFLQSGFHHVLGMDHILFILGLFLLVPEWKPLMGQSLLFTLAHSITLAIAVLWSVPLSDYWVEILIALTIGWIGIENLFSNTLGKRRLILVFCFGLLHGLGFASVMAAKLREVPREQLAGPLLGFNVGVEMAQISVLVVAFALLWPARKWTPQIRTVGSLVIALAGMSWAIQQLFFPAFPLF